MTVQNFCRYLNLCVSMIPSKEQRYVWSRCHPSKGKGKWTVRWLLCELLKRELWRSYRVNVCHAIKYAYATWTVSPETSVSSISAVVSSSPAGPPKRLCLFQPGIIKTEVKVEMCLLRLDCKHPWWDFNSQTLYKQN